MDLSRERRIRKVCLTAGLAGAVALVFAFLLQRPTVTADGTWLTIGLAAGLVAAQLFPVHLTHEGDSEALRLEEVFFVPMVFLLPAFDLLLAIAVAVAVAAAVNRRGLLKATFNVGMITAASGAGVALAHVIGIGGGLGPRDFAAATAGALVLSAGSALAVAAVISVAQGVPMAGLLSHGLAVRVATWLGSISLGALVLLAGAGHPLALLVAALPAVVLQFAYQGALRQWSERQQTGALYDAALRIHGSVDSGAIRQELAEAARELLFAGTVRIVDATAPVVEHRLRADVSAGEALEVADRATGGAWSPDDRKRLQALAAVGRGALANALTFEQLNAITRSLGEGVVALDEHGTVTFANPAAESLLGWRRGELVGTAIAESIDPDGRDLAAQTSDWVHLPRLRSGETLRMEEHVVTRRDGTPLDVSLTASPVVRDGTVVGAVVVFRDVRDRKALEQRLVHQAFHDPLTGLPNRALFLDRLEHARARSLRDGTVQAVLFLDVDRFKVINDSLGHRIGDQVLQTVASRLVGVLRPSDTVARFGGDEFTVLLESVHDTGEAAQTAERILRAVQLPMVAGGRDVVVTASVGLAVAEPGNAPADLLAAADIAMYQAKGRGKNRYVLASPDADERALARLDLEMELRRALDEDELEVHYQPVVDAMTGRLHGLEALVRWRHPTLGLLGPGHFMDVAEDTGLVLQLGEWVLEQACRAGVEWQRRHPRSPIVMAVNLSARQFSQPDLCERVAAVLRATGLEPARLALEITETVVMDDTAVTLATLRALKQLKVRLSIDDFGTGYSSLSYLKRFPVDAVKIDKSFVDGLESGPVDREIVQAVIRLAAAVGMQTVAEGVETREQLEALQALGCTQVQGYLLSRPGTLDEVERLLRRRLPMPRPSVEDLSVRLG